MRKVLPKVKKIINKSIEEAKLYNDSEIKIEHIVTALINDYNNEAIRYLLELGIDIDDFHRTVENHLVKKTEIKGAPSSKILPMNSYTKKK